MQPPNASRSPSVRYETNETPQTELLLDAATASRVLSISPRHLWTLTKAGQIPALRLGRRVLYPCRALDQWIQVQIQREGEA